MQWCNEKELVKKSFGKVDFQDGDVIILRNGERLIFANNEFVDTEDDYVNNLYGTCCLTNDLNFVGDYSEDRNSDFDIVEVRRPTLYDTLFKRDKAKMTLKEIQEKLGFEIEIVDDEEEFEYERLEKVLIQDC